MESDELTIHATIGEYLATGLTNGEIIEKLQLDDQLTFESAQQALRNVYSSWSSVREGLEVQPEDERNWHQYLRMRLLQETLKDKTTPSLRLALQILDSLANIQGIAIIGEQSVPLPIMLIEKPPEEKQITGETT